VLVETPAGFVLSSPWRRVAQISTTP
jgi:hypothetical protein